MRKFFHLFLQSPAVSTVELRKYTIQFKITKIHVLKNCKPQNYLKERETKNKTIRQLQIQSKVIARKY